MSKTEACTRNGTAQKSLRSCGRWQGGIEKKKRKIAAAVTLETVNSSVGLNAEIVRAETDHGATAGE